MGEVGITCDYAKRVDDFIEEHLHCIQCQCDVGGVLSTGVLILEAWSECLLRQSILPARSAKSHRVAVTTPDHDAPELRDEA